MPARNFQPNTCAAASFPSRSLIPFPQADTPSAPWVTRDELPARSWLSWKVFHPDEPDEKYQGWEWYKNVQRVPLYRRDLDIVAVAEDGELAAFCTVWFDDVTRTAVFEPIGTHPNHQKRGLGKAVMSEGLRRAQRLGATLATVSSYSTAHTRYMNPWASQNLTCSNRGSRNGKIELIMKIGMNSITDI